MKKILLVTFIFSLNLLAKDFMIFNIAQDLPMGEKDELIRKNYYINLGKNQGVAIGTKLNVFRKYSVFNQYDTKTRIHYKIKVGELEVIHTDEASSIARSLNVYKGEKVPITDLKYLMIGDNVSISVE